MVTTTRQMAERLILGHLWSYVNDRHKVLRFLSNINHDDFHHESNAAEGLLSGIREGFSSVADLYHHISKLDALNGRFTIADIVSFSSQVTSEQQVLDYARWFAHEVASERIRVAAASKDDWSLEQMSKAIKEAEAIKASATDPEPMTVRLSKAINNLTEPDKLLVSNPLEHVMPGIPYLTRGGFHLVAARPGIGKTSVLIQHSIAFAKKKKRVVLACYEMNHTDYVGRTLIAMDNPLTSSELYGSPDMAAKTIYAHAGELEQIMEYITFLDNPGNIDNLIALLGAVESPDIVLIDYLQIIPASNDTRKAIREVQVGDISRKIKLAALQMNCPFVVAAQLSRAGDGEKPKLSHLRESGTLEQDADTVTFLYQQEDGGKVASTQKNRRGGFGEHDVRWNGEFMRFDRYHTSF